MSNKNSFLLPQLLANYLKKNHKDIVFFVNENPSLSCDGFRRPNLMILHSNRDFSGLFLFLKPASPYKVDGELRNNKYLKADSKSISELNDRGYKADFCFDFEDTVLLIENYINGKDF